MADGIVDADDLVDDDWIVEEDDYHHSFTVDWDTATVVMLTPGESGARDVWCLSDDEAAALATDLLVAVAAIRYADRLDDNS